MDGDREGSEAVGRGVGLWDNTPASNVWLMSDYCNQHGLILRILPSGGKQWIWRATIHGKRIDLGLGSWPYVLLAEARQAAFEHRTLARAKAIRGSYRLAGASLRSRKRIGVMQEPVDARAGHVCFRRCITPIAFQMCVEEGSDSKRSAKSINDDRRSLERGIAIPAAHE